MSSEPFKGDIDIDKFKTLIAEQGAQNIAFVRVEADTNLIGGQPVSVQNLSEMRAVCGQHGILQVMDASLFSDNLYFNKQSEAVCKK